MWDFRLSERADQDCADEKEHRAKHNDVELQGNVHERAPYGAMSRKADPPAVGVKSIPPPKQGNAVRESLSGSPVRLVENDDRCQQ